MSWSQATTIAAIIVLALSLHTAAVERCEKNPMKVCSSYCCEKQSDDFFSTTSEKCCYDCRQSIYLSTSTSNECLGIPNITLILVAVFATVVFLIIVVGLIVACFLGCICSSLTGRQRYRGRVISRPGEAGAAAAATVSTATPVYVPPPGSYPVQTQVYAGQPGVGANPNVYVAVGGGQTVAGVYPPPVQGYPPVHEFPAGDPPPYTSK